LVFDALWVFEALRVYEALEALPLSKVCVYSNRAFSEGTLITYYLQRQAGD